MSISFSIHTSSTRNTFSVRNRKTHHSGAFPFLLARFIFENPLDLQRSPKEAQRKKHKNQLPHQKANGSRVELRGTDVPPFETKLWAEAGNLQRRDRNDREGEQGRIRRRNSAQNSKHSGRAIRCSDSHRHPTVSSAGEKSQGKATRPQRSFARVRNYLRRETPGDGMRPRSSKVVGFRWRELWRSRGKASCRRRRRNEPPRRCHGGRVAKALTWSGSLRRDMSGSAWGRAGPGKPDRFSRVVRSTVQCFERCLLDGMRSDVLILWILYSRIVFSFK